LYFCQIQVSKEKKNSRISAELGFLSENEKEMV